MNEKQSQFLIDFISNKYLTDSERKKAVELAFKELGENSIGMSEKRELRTYLMSAKPNNVDADQIAENTRDGDELTERPTGGIHPHRASRNGVGLPGYLDPELTSKFLLAYNQDPILKYTCHEIDEIEIVDDICKLCETKRYDLEAHQQLISKAFNAVQKEITIPANVKGLISGYINGTGFWSSSKIHTNWKSPDLLEWGKANPNRVPNPGLNLINKLQFQSFNSFKPFNSGLTGNRIRNFSELSIFFKYLFHISSDNSLKKMIENTNRIKGWEDKAVFRFSEVNFWEKMEVFTHVEQVINTYKKLMGLIFYYVENHSLDKPLINFSFKEEGSSKVFGIHHENSTYGHTLNDTMGRMGETYNYIIDKYINGICDFYLRADFNNTNYAEINLWDEKIMKPRTLETFKGVQYILKLKK